MSDKSWEPDHTLTHYLTLSHSHTHSISHSITLDMLNNFCFHLYAQNSPSHFLTLTLSRYLTLTLSQSHTLPISHWITLDINSEQPLMRVFLGPCWNFWNDSVKIVYVPHPSSNFGANMRKVLQDTGILIIPGCTRSGDFQQCRVYQPPEGEEWRLGILESLLELKGIIGRKWHRIDDIRGLHHKSSTLLMIFVII